MKNESHWISNLALLVCFAAMFVGLSAVNGCSLFNISLADIVDLFKIDPDHNVVDHLTDPKEAASIFEWVVYSLIPFIGATGLWWKLRKKKKEK